MFIDLYSRGFSTSVHIHYPSINFVCLSVSVCMGVCVMDCHSLLNNDHDLYHIDCTRVRKLKSLITMQGCRNQGGKRGSRPPAQKVLGLSPPATATANW